MMQNCPKYASGEIILPLMYRNRLAFLRQFSLDLFLEANCLMYRR